MNSHEARQAYTNLLIAQHLMDKAVMEAHDSRLAGMVPANPDLIAIRETNRKFAEGEYRRLCALKDERSGTQRESHEALC